MGLASWTGLVRSKSFVFFVLLTGHAGYAAYSGVIMSPDSYLYSRAGDTLLTCQFDYGRFLQETPLPHSVYYLSFVTLVALCKLLGGTYWQVLLVSVNLMGDALAGLLLVRLALRLTNRLAGGWCALVFYGACFEIFNFSRYVLSDPTFIFLGVVLFRCMAHVLLRDPIRRPWIAWIGITVLSLLIFYHRPTGMAFVPIVATALISWLGQQGARSEDTLGQLYRWVLIAWCVAAVGGVSAYTWVMQDSTRWPVPVFKEAIERRALEFARGEIVTGHEYTYHARPQSWLDYVAIAGDRFLHFFYFVAKTYSRAHSLYNMFYFLPLYLLGLMGFLRTVLGRSNLSREARAVILLAGLTVFDFAIFHAMTHLDYDWRYRLPVLPHLILLASVGLAQITIAASSEKVDAPK